MTQRKNLLTLTTFLGLSLVFASCHTSGGPANGLSTDNKVVWHQLSDIERMNPFLSTDEGAIYVQNEIWETLTGQNPRTYEYIPLLAGLPEQSEDHLTWTFPINQGAHWSDGKPVTSADVIFSYKAVLNPQIINASSLRVQFTTLDSVWCPNGDSSKVSLHFSKFRYNMIDIINFLKILPKHIFDPKGLMDKVTWADLHNENSKNPAILEFATWFQVEKNGRDAKYLVGSGPYLYKEWIANDRITLQRDTNYWGKNRPWQEAYPDQLVFKTIKDQNAMLTSLKSKDIDVSEAITPNQYLTDLDTTKDKSLSKDTVYMNLYSFISWNNSRPMFKSKNTRKALTMLINRDEILHSVLHDLAKKIGGPVMPTQPNCDPTAQEPDYNVDAGKKMLADDGWAPGPDGILQKNIDGKMTPFRFTFQVNSGNEVRKQILLVISEELKKAGIEAQVSAMEWSVYLENTKSHNYDACYSGWVGNAGVEDDISQLWNSAQIPNKGSNFYCYSNPAADQLLNGIEVEPDKAKRFEMSHQLQHIIVDDQPVTYLFSTPLFIGWVNRFDNVEFFRARPPYAPAYWIVRGSGVKRIPTDAVMSLNPAERTEPKQQSAIVP